MSTNSVSGRQVGVRPLVRRATDGGSRRWCVPPAMLYNPGETLEGEPVLAELPGELGLLLWRTVRDVTLWAGTPEDARARLFAEGSADRRLALLATTEIPAEVSASVDTLHGMLSISSRADSELVSICCLEIATWAGRAGLLHTAIAFAQAAALASPDFAEPAVNAGAYARAAGQMARAGTWLRRAVSLARRERDGAAYSAALVELGAIEEQHDNLIRAERFYRWAFRAGRRFAARRARMRAAHGLFRLALRQGDAASAARFALSAQSAYEAGTAGGTDLLLDLARYWTSLGEPTRVRAALRRLWPSLTTLPRASQLVVLTLTARTRAEPGHLRKGAAAARAAWVLMADQEIADEIRCAAAVNLAYAARIAGDLIAFTRAKRAALRLAPQTIYAAIATEIAELWPVGEASVGQLGSAS